MLLRGTHVVALGVLLAVSATPASAGTLYWNGVNNGTGDFNDATNWSTDPGATTPNPLAKPGTADDVLFNISTVNTAQTNQLANTAQTVKSLTFESSGTTVIDRNTTLADTGTTTLTLASGGGIAVGAVAGAVRIGGLAEGGLNDKNRVAVTPSGNFTITHNGSNALAIGRAVIPAINLGRITVELNGSGSGTTEYGQGLGQSSGTTNNLVINSSGTGVHYFRGAQTVSSVTIYQGKVGARGSHIFGASTPVTFRGGAFGAIQSVRSQANPLTISGDFQLGGVSIPAGTLITAQGGSGTTFSGTVDLDGGTRTITLGGGGNTFSGVLSNGGLIVATTGSAYTLDLSGTNIYAGGTTINSNATLRLSHATDTLKDDGAINVNGGTLNVDNPDTVGAVTLISGTISGDSALTGSSYAVKSGTVSTVLAGSGVTLTKTTEGMVTLSGPNTYDGLTTVSAGTLTLGHATDTLDGDISVSGGTLNVDNPDTVGVVTLISGTISGDSALTGSSYDVRTGTVSAVLAGSGVTLTKTTGGAVVLSGISTYNGGTFLNEGRLGLRNSNAPLGAGTVTINGGAIGSVVSPRSLSNKLIINTDFQLGGVNAPGFGNSYTTFNGDVDLGGGTRTISLADSATFNGEISNGGLMIVANPTSRVLTLGANSVSTYTGPTTLSSGTLIVNGTLGDTPVTVEAGLLELARMNALSSATALDIRSGAEVRLSFAGTNVIASLTVNGELKKRGVYAAGSLSGLTGTAGAYLQTLGPPPKGTLVSVQ